MTTATIAPLRADPPVPGHVEEIDAPWVEHVLDAAGMLGEARVAGVARRVIGAEKGFLSATVRVELAYAGEPPPGTPRSLVVKIEPPAGTFRDAERRVDAFSREVRFYRELASLLPIRLPRVYFAAAREDGSALVMEDLTGLDGADQLHGLAHRQVVATVRTAARLHAAFWDSAALRALDWMPERDHFFDDGFADHWPSFARTYELRIGRDGLRLGESIVARLAWLEERIAARPMSVIHGDLRADNLLFAPRPDGAAPDVVLLDWQLATRSLAAIDVARVMGGSEPAAERRGHQLEVFAAWHEALLEAGVRGYAFEEALDDFRLAALYCLVIPVKGLYLAGAEPGARTARLIDAMAERFYASALELDAGRLLD
jgi:aminoglycoside phosphotransferase (APT) family kinase protein